jgi:MFS family permease
MGIE